MIVLLLLNHYRLTKLLSHPNVIASFFGHLHRDMIRLFIGDNTYESENLSIEQLGLGFIQPSVLPAGANPSFRRYNYEAEKKVIYDFEQFYLPMDEIGAGL